MKKLFPLFGIAGLLALASCGPTAGESSSSSSGGNSQSSGTTVSGTPANGIYDWTERPDGYTQPEWVDEQSHLLYKMEDYALRHHLGGIPLYDDASIELFSPRITLASENYIPDYGFGINESTLDPNGNMYGTNAPYAGPNDRNYFQSYMTTDSGTFNYWNSQGEDVGGRNAMISNSYFSVAMNATKDGYVWRNVLSKDERPIPLDDDGNPVEYEEGATYRKWRVHLYTSADDTATTKYEYRIAETSPYAAKYNHRGIELEDYMTPFRAMLDNLLIRASGLITDTSGFVGASDYAYSPKKTDEEWANVGIQLNEKEGSIDFEFITPQTEFYAMYNLSSTLYSPLPREYIEEIGSGSWSRGCELFGTYGSVQGGDYTTTVSNLLSCGPYIVTSWQQGVEAVYVRNDTYSLAGEVHFQGYVETMYKDDKAAYNAFTSGLLDNVTCPSDYTQNHANDPYGHRAEGSTILKINLNTCTEDEWEYFFGPEGTMYQHTANKAWDVKWIMSNDDFLDGVFFSINRQSIAQKMGRNPAVGYLSNSYKIDPENNVSYRDTSWGKAAVSRYTSVNEYGYSVSKAAGLFRTAVKEGLDKGKIKRGETITIDFTWRYQTSIDKVGDEIATDIETVFNGACRDYGVTLDVYNHAVTDYTQAYNAMDRGEFDFAEGAITGNILNPLEFMSVICTNDLSQGFTCSWGEPTEHLSATYPITWDCDGDGIEETSFSYDAFYTACNGSAVVEDGVNVALASVPTKMEDRASVSGSNTVFYFNVPTSVVDETGHLAIEYKFSYLWFFVATSDNASIGNSYYALASNDEDAAQYCAFDDRIGIITVTIPTNSVRSYYNGLRDSLGSSYSNICIWLGVEATFPSGTVRTLQITNCYVTPEVAGIA